MDKARKENKIRTLSISTIQDTIFQNLIANVICDDAEQKFEQNIDQYSYGYRKKKSSKLAVRRILKCVEDGYLHILDGDIEKFFDKIDHTLLKQKMEVFFGVENKLIQRFLYKFIHVKRIPAGKITEYKKNVSYAEKRNEGIPQGGVLSGLLANVFLYDFDVYVVNELMPKYNFKYFRYADDFVLLFKERDSINKVFDQLEAYLANQKLKLHPIGKKSKILDLSSVKKESLNFLGFEISPRYLKIKEDNLKKFRKRIIESLKNIEVVNKDEYYFNSVTKHINAKITGLEEIIEQEHGLCPVCGLLIPKRSWIGYFMMIDDVRLLRNIDTMIRKAIYVDYHQRTKHHLRKKDLLKFTLGRLKSVERMYYIYRKQVRKHEKKGHCKCKRFYDTESQQIRVIKL
jgi:retron-type reverse transcriptase